MLVTPFSEETEQRMRDFFRSLNEKDRRRYAGLEADRLGHGGISYISEILGCDRKTVSKGIIGHCQREKKFQGSGSTPTAVLDVVAEVKGY